MKTCRICGATSETVKICDSCGKCVPCHKGDSNAAVALLMAFNADTPISDFTAGLIDLVADEAKAGSENLELAETFVIGVIDLYRRLFGEWVQHAAETGSGTAAQVRDALVKRASGESPLQHESGEEMGESIVEWLEAIKRDKESGEDGDGGIDKE